MAISLSDNINYNAPKHSDARYGPWTGITHANENVLPLQRAIGLTVGVISGNTLTEYWYYSGVTDSDLILKTVSVLDAGNGLTKNNDTIKLGGTLNQSNTNIEFGEDQSISIGDNVLPSSIKWLNSGGTLSLIVIGDNESGTEYGLKYSYDGVERIVRLGYGEKHISIGDGTTGISIIDNIDSIGFFYDSDYSSSGETKGDRWIPDKGWIKSYFLDSFTGITEASNGLTRTGNSAELGGTLNKNTSIDLNEKELSLAPQDESVFLKLKPTYIIPYNWPDMEWQSYSAGGFTEFSNDGTTLTGQANDFDGFNLEWQFDPSETRVLEVELSWDNGGSNGLGSAYLIYGNGTDGGLVNTVSPSQSISSTGTNTFTITPPSNGDGRYRIYVYPPNSIPQSISFTVNSMSFVGAGDLDTEVLGKIHFGVTNKSIEIAASGMTITDTESSTGLVYADDYSVSGATMGDRWIPDVGWVKSYVGQPNIQFPPVSGTTELKTLNTTSDINYPDKGTIYVEAENSWYALNRESSASESLPNIVAPTTGTGRWIKVNPFPQIPNEWHVDSNNPNASDNPNIGGTKLTPFISINAAHSYMADGDIIYLYSDDSYNTWTKNATIIGVGTIKPLLISVDLGKGGFSNFNAEVKFVNIDLQNCYVGGSGVLDLDNSYISSFETFATLKDMKDSLLDTTLYDMYITGEIINSEINSYGNMNFTTAVSKIVNSDIFCVGNFTFDFFIPIISSTIFVGHLYNSNVVSATASIINVSGDINLNGNIILYRSNLQYDGTLNKISPTSVIQSDSTRPSPTSVYNLIPITTTGNTSNTSITLVEDSPTTEIDLYINGLLNKNIGISGDYYFSTDNGVTESDKVKGAKLYWNGIIAGYELDSTFRIDLIYE